MTTVLASCRRLALVAFIVLVGCGCAVSTRGAGPGWTVADYDTTSDTWVITVDYTAAYNPQNQQYGSSFAIAGDGTVKHSSTSAGHRITTAQVRALMDQTVALGLLESPDLESKIYDAGDMTLTLTLRERQVRLTVSRMEPDAPSPQGLNREAVRTFCQLVYTAIH